ncbi:hypothetical protein AHAS_Ahas03G0251300 [Arachis hypogaea]
MRTLDLVVMHIPEFSEYAIIDEGNGVVDDGEFSIGIKFSSKELVISTIKSYTMQNASITSYHTELYITPQIFEN